jgi:protein arginine N-methyltransferase 3
MINFIRCHKLTDPKQLLTAESTPLWQDEKYMKPVDFESWLAYDFDELSIGAAAKGEVNGADESSSLLKVIQELQQQLRAKDQMLEQAASDMSTMKESYKRLLEKEPSMPEVEVKGKSTKSSLANGVGSINIDDDSSYFDTYSHFSIHHTMLSDQVRTESYRDAILKNPAAFKDKDVLDIGSGTGILSLFASQAGAKNVYAVDQSDIIYHAMEIAQVNKVTNIKFLKGRLEDIELPVKKVDAIISEWMGYFLLFEGMLDSVIYGRNNYLKENGLMLPNRCTVSIVGYGSQERYGNFIKFFDDVYGYNMRCVVKDILKEAHVERCTDEFVLTKPNMICDVDINTCDLNYNNFSYDFSLEVLRDGEMNSICGYFDTFFDLPEAKIFFSTSPAATQTHWQQTVFYLDEPVQVKANEKITGTFICNRDRNDLRSLKIEMRVFHKVFKYDLN